MLAGQLFGVPDSVKGFDANQVISDAAARAFVAAGYRFAIRYVRRLAAHATDLQPDEATRLLAAGLAIACVQHVESETSWVPSAEKGATQGMIGAGDVARIGFPAGTMLWLDLEGVATNVPATEVIAHCNAWHTVVSAAGYLPGLYVGWRCGLSASQLYHELPFIRYWSAGNLNNDELPAIRGVCMRQQWRKPPDVPPGVTVDFNVDRVATDERGGRPVVFGPAGWLPVPLVG